MGRILIDTGEVTSLRDALRDTSRVVESARAEVISAFARAATGPSFDPAFRAADVDGRTQRCAAGLHQLQATLVEHSRRIDSFVDRAIGLDRGSGFVVPIMPWPRDNIPWAIGWPRTPQPPRFEIPLPRIPPRIGAGLGLALPAVWRVGQGLLSKGRSLINESVGSFRRLRDRVADRLKAFLAQAWNAIWGTITDLFQQVSADIARLGRTVAETFRETYEAVVSVGRRRAQVAWWYVSAAPRALWESADDLFRNENLPWGAKLIRDIADFTIVGWAMDFSVWLIDCFSLPYEAFAYGMNAAERKARETWDRTPEMLAETGLVVLTAGSSRTGIRGVQYVLRIFDGRLGKLVRLGDAIRTLIEKYPDYAPQVRHLFDDIEADGNATAWIGARGGGHKDAGIADGALFATAGAPGAVGAGAEASGRAELGVASGEVEGRAFIGGRAETSASARAGLEGVDVSAEMGGFAGAEAEVAASAEAFGAQVSGGANVSAGIGAHANVDASVSVERIELGMDVGATVGLGAGFEFEVSFSPKETVRDIKRFLGF